MILNGLFPSLWLDDWPPEVEYTSCLVKSCRIIVFRSRLMSWTVVLESTMNGHEQLTIIRLLVQWCGVWRDWCARLLDQVLLHALCRCFRVSDELVDECLECLTTDRLGEQVGDVHLGLDPLNVHETQVDCLLVQVICLVYVLIARWYEMLSA